MYDSAEKRSLVVTLNSSFPQDKLHEGSQVWENMRFFAPLRMTNRLDGGLVARARAAENLWYVIVVQNLFRD